MRSPFLLFALLLVGIGCEEEQEESGPDVAVAQFFAAMRGVHGDAEAAREAVELLWTPARENLEERARRASALSGRELSPGELLVPSWFAPHLVPARYETRLEGSWAEVSVVAADGRSSTTRCVLEDGEWKVALELPPLSPIRQREPTGH